MNHSTTLPVHDEKPDRVRPAGLLRSIAFVYLAAMIMVIGSERFFWYWSTSVTAQAEGALFYSAATAAGLALMRRYHVTDWWSLLLVTPVIAFVVEGVITPVIYSAGPIPFFPAWFSFWHGVLAFMGLVFGLRHLVLHRPRWMTALAAAGLGLFWGLWSITLLLPENVNDEELMPHHGGSLQILDPAEFAVYAGVMTAVLLAAHAVIGFVWPKVGRSSGRTGRLDLREGLVAAVCLFFAGAWTISVPWALPMLLAYCWVQIKGLRWHRSSTTPDTSSLLDRLQGRPGFGALAPLALMAPAAALTYQLLWSASLSDTAIRVIMYGTIVVQALAGAVLVVMALLRARRLRTSTASESVASVAPSAPSPAESPEVNRVSQ